MSAFVSLFAPTPLAFWMHAACLFAAIPCKVVSSFSLMPCLSDCSVCLQPCKSREHPSEPLHPVWAQRRHVPPLSSVQPPPSPRSQSPNGPAALVARARCCSAPSYAAAICMFPIHSPTPIAHLCSDARRPVFFSLCFFALVFFFLLGAALCAQIAAARSLKPPEPERNSLTRSCQAYTGTRRRVRARRVKDIPGLRGLSQADVYAAAEKCFARIQSRLWSVGLCCSVSLSFSFLFLFFLCWPLAWLGLVCRLNHRGYLRRFRRALVDHWADRTPCTRPDRQPCLE